MALRPTPQATPTVIQHRATGAGLFGGTVPAGDPTPDASNALWKYAEAAAGGGLFVWAGREPILVNQLLIDLGGSGNVTIKVVNLDPATFETAPAPIADEDLTVYTATGVSFVALDETNFVKTLLPFQAIQVVTTSTGAKQIAQLTGYISRVRTGF